MLQTQNTFDTFQSWLVFDGITLKAENATLHNYVVQKSQDVCEGHFRNCWKFCPNWKSKHNKLLFVCMKSEWLKQQFYF